MNPDRRHSDKPIIKLFYLNGISNYASTVLRILKGALSTFAMTKGAEASAALAYYTLFSLFPLVLIIVSVGSFFVDKVIIEERMIALLPEVVPISHDFIIAVVREVFVNRGAITILSFIGLIWSATALFTVIMRNINAAWPKASPRSFLRMRLLSLVLIVALVILFIISTFLITFKQLLINLGFGITVESVRALFSNKVFDSILNNTIRMMLFFALYYWTPQIKVKKIASLIGAIVTALLWLLLSTVFSSYINSGMASYDIVYGSLGKIVALMGWIYLNAFIVLWGAHLTSSIGRNSTINEKPI